MFGGSLLTYAININQYDVGKGVTYLIFAHLKKGSIQVSKGDTVEVGTLLAQVGNSGTTFEPHLHLQHQRNYPSDSVLLITDEGLPIFFE